MTRSPYSTMNMIAMRFFPPQLPWPLVTSKQSLRPSFAHSSRVDKCSACEPKKAVRGSSPRGPLLSKCDARCRAVKFLLASNIALFLIGFVFATSLFVTAWFWYGHFSKSLFSLNLWLVVYRLSVLYRHLSVNVSPRGNTTAFWDWSQVFGDRTFWVPDLYRTLSQ